MSTATAAPPKKIHEMKREELLARHVEIIEMRKEEPAIIREGQLEMGFSSPHLFDTALLRDPHIRFTAKGRELLERLDEIRRASIELVHIVNRLVETAPKFIDGQIEPLKRVAIGLLQRSNATKEAIDNWQDRRPVDDARGLQSWQDGMDKLRAELADIAAENADVQAEMGRLANLKLTEL